MVIGAVDALPDVPEGPCMHGPCAFRPYGNLHLFCMVVGGVPLAGTPPHTSQESV